MTAKQLMILLAVSVLALVGYIGYIAAQSAVVVGAFQVALVTVAVSAALAAVGGLAFAGTWAYYRFRHWAVGLRTADGQSVQFFAAEGQVYAVNPGGHSIQALHADTRTYIEPVEDVAPSEWGMMRQLHFFSRRNTTKIIDQIAAPEQPLELPAPAIPEMVRIEQAIDPDNVSINRLYLGAGPGGEAVYGRLKDLSHIAIGGTSRWGKSTLEQALLYQLVIAKEDIDFYLSDVGGTAFLSFGIPYADSPELSEKLVGKVYQIFEERKAQFKDAGQQVRTGIRSLDVFNQITGEALPVIVLAMDEVTALMADSKQMAHQINSLILQAGKYGIFLILSGQNWTARNVPTTARDQFSSRFQMKAMDRYQANILISNSGAEQFTTKGRASVLLPGSVAPVQIQTPLIDEQTIVTAIERRPRTIQDLQWIVADEPETETGGDDQSDRAETIRQLYRDGMSKTEIAQYFGYQTNSGRIFYEIKAALKDLESGE